MVIRGAVAAVAVVAIGAGVGYGVARADKPPESPHGSIPAAAPVPADPEMPIARPAPYHPDPDYPQLPTGLPYVRTRIKGGVHVWSVQRPQGWLKRPGTATDPAGTTYWSPAQEPPDAHGYALKISPLAGRASPATEVQAATATLFDRDDDVQVVRLAPVGNPDRVWVHFRSPDNYRRLTYLAWVRIPGTNSAGLEISVTGRVVDEAGLADLFNTVRTSARMIR